MIGKAIAIVGDAGVTRETERIKMTATTRDMIQAARKASNDYRDRRREFAQSRILVCLDACGRQAEDMLRALSASCREFKPKALTSS